jgi:predicted MPP superfamily phosphohydrolase
MRRRFLFFMFFFPSVTLPLYGYLGWRLCSGFTQWALLAVPFLSVISFPFLVARRSRGGGNSFVDVLAARISYASMGLVSFLLVASVAREVAVALGFARFTPLVELGFAFGLFFAGSAAGLLGPRVKRVRVDGAPAELRGLRIAQVSDLHLSSHLGERYARRVAGKVVDAKPDLIALTGDIGDGSVPALKEAIGALAPLAKAAPAFYVPGNHEVYWDLPAWLAAFRGVGMRVLLNQGEQVEVLGKRVFVGGITDPACEVAGMPPDLAAAARGAEGALWKILLSHRPDPAEAAADAGFDLQLSGHTHGGQFFPWTIVAALVHRFSRGLHRVGRMWVYVSVGTGSWGPRIRLGTMAEVTILELA